MSTFKKTSSVIVNKCLGIKSNEKVVIITDANKRNIALEIFFQSIQIAETILLEIPTTSRNGEEPPKRVYNILENSDVIVAPTTMSLSHTKAFVNARRKGARVASLPGITDEMFLHSIDVNYDNMSKLTKRLADYFRNKNNIKVHTENGTDVEFSIKNRIPMNLDGVCHEKGGFINLPDGEMCLAPIEESFNGVLAFDLSISPDHKTKWGVGGLLKCEIVRVELQKGKIVSFSKGKKANVLKNLIYNSDENANCIAEFAIGTNKKARITGFILEDEKSLGTIHFAFGSNVSLGGKNQSNLHLDAVMGKADIFVDDVQIMKKGNLII